MPRYTNTAHVSAEMYYVKWQAAWTEITYNYASKCPLLEQKDLMHINRTKAENLKIIHLDFRSYKSYKCSSNCYIKRCTNVIAFGLCAFQGLSSACFGSIAAAPR